LANQLDLRASPDEVFDVLADGWTNPRGSSAPMRSRTSTPDSLPWAAESAVREWVKQADNDDGQRDGLITDEKAELARLRRENKVLREEREILKKAAAFFARRPGEPLSVQRGGEGSTRHHHDVSSARGIPVRLLRLGSGVTAQPRTLFPRVADKRLMRCARHRGAVLMHRMAPTRYRSPGRSLTT
jgi:transposase